ncbi:tigger transposable element-derived protein 4-like [Ixodes scapularis]
MGLFYKALPTKTLTYNGETCSGGKRSKERITVLVGANMNGSKKLKMVVAGKSKHPRCFRGIPKLPVTYHVNGRAWITQAIFETWLREEDARYTRQNRNVVYAVDNYPAHGHGDGLKSICLEYLPANATAVIQPMDQGVIQNLEGFLPPPSPPADLLSALHILTHAWEQVKVSTVQGCFRHAGFSRQEVIPDEEDGAAEADALFPVRKRCPKTKITSLRTVEAAVALAVLEFNLGARGFERALPKMEISPGSHKEKHSYKATRDKITKAKDRALYSSKLVHKRHKLEAIVREQHSLKAEGTTYAPGGF